MKSQRIDFKENFYMTSNAIAFCLLKEYVSSLKNIFVFSFCRLADYMGKAR